MSRFAVVVVIGLGLSACSFDDTYLPALQADPVAELALTRAELVDVREQAEVESGFMGKPVHAEIVRSYRVRPEVDVEAAAEELVAAARAAGWVFDPADPDRNEEGRFSMEGYKELEPCWANLFVAASSRERRMSMYLEFGPNPPWDDAVHLPVASPVTLGDISRHPYLVFEGMEGEVVELTLDPAWADLERVVVATPSGAKLWEEGGLDDSSTGTVVMGPETLPETGAYLVFLDAAPRADGPVQVQVDTDERADAGDLVMSMPLRSSAEFELDPGQAAAVTFEARTYDRLSMQVSTTLDPDDVLVAVSRPDGESLWTETALRRTDLGAAVYLDTLDIPVDGTYTIEIRHEAGAESGGEVDVELFEPHGINEDTSYDGFEVPYQLGNEFYSPGSSDRWPLNASVGDEIRVSAAALDLRSTDGSEPGLVLEVRSPSDQSVWRGESEGGLIESDLIVVDEEGPYWLYMDGVGATIGAFRVTVEVCGSGRFRC